MELEQLSALVLFAFVSTFTPGPNNIMLMTSGANVGYKRTLPHMSGVAFGFAFMVMLVGIGLTGIFEAYPVTHQILKYVSLTYLGYLAIKIALSGKAKDVENFKPMTFLAAASFQWVNPKGWSMALSSVTLYSNGGGWLELSIIASTFLLVNFPSGSFWIIAGRELQRWLTSNIRVRSFNMLMAALLVGSTLPML
ncbi:MULTISPECIES: LysE family translocator [Vibrio]|uniref:LysE family translocator n=2 Tax=Vibrio neptunius TaxID=170651 RepID=A0ABS3A6C8_9VIBR|nr:MULTISPECIES: LysE family translocator [Vibrio]MBN3494689.1 LysE family translocator [Vibrio neptunius]MBN3517165.1 LysE family translocator [Vibrio neptunius]MBN3551269.1 LysE family translocator [Vibrio neptunius]MBN3579560.1 LysE family translocator [Vibrio neptunius]MCH9873225.1 LysE family translocator [Vibrio neptunius]